MTDANLFFGLETWTLNPADPNTTLYLTQIQSFQSHMTTVAYKIAGGNTNSTGFSGPSSLRAGRQDKIPSEFSAKITKSFLDSLYAFLDGMVHLASDDVEVKRYLSRTNSRPNQHTIRGQLDLADLQNPVRTRRLRLASFRDSQPCRTLAS